MSITLDRNLSSSTNAELKTNSLIAVPILYLDFPSITKYYAGSNINVTVGTNTIMPSGTYVGVGGISNIASVQENLNLQSSQLICELNGIDSTHIALVLGQQYFARDASFALAVLDSNYKIIGDPILLFKGFISVLKADIESKAKITVELSSILADWERPRVKKYNDATQRDTDSSDKGFDNVAPLVNKEVTWG